MLACFFLFPEHTKNGRCQWCLGVGMVSWDTSNLLVAAFLQCPENVSAGETIIVGHQLCKGGESRPTIYYCIFIDKSVQETHWEHPGTETASLKELRSLGDVSATISELGKLEEFPAGRIHATIAVGEGQWKCPCYSSYLEAFLLPLKRPIKFQSRTNPHLKRYTYTSGMKLVVSSDT